MPFATAAQILGGEAVKLTSEQAMQLETALAQLNFDPGPIDGVIDDRTRAAIRLYQDFAALPTDANATPELLAEVLSVARSFAEMRATRALESATDVSTSDTQETPAEPQVPRREPDPPKVAAAEAPGKVPDGIPAPAPEQAMPPAVEPGAVPAETEGTKSGATESGATKSRAVPLSETLGKARATPEVDSQQAASPQADQAPRAAPAAPTEAAAPEEPEVEASIAEPSPPPPTPAPEDPSPRAGTAAPVENAAAPGMPEPEPSIAEPSLPSTESVPEDPRPSAATAAPAQAAASEEPEAEPSIAKPSLPPPELAPEDPSPIEKKAAPAAGFNIGSVISRLAKTGKIANKLAESDSSAGPDAVPPPGLADSGQLARVPAPAPTPARAHTKPTDGYAAFQDAYEAAQAGDFEYAVQLYTDAIKSKKLTLEHLGDAHFNRANVFHSLGRYDKSIADYGVTIGAKPNFAGAYYNRGFSYQAKGERQKAVGDFRRARDLGLRRLGVRAPDRSPPLR